MIGRVRRPRPHEALAAFAFAALVAIALVKPTAPVPAPLVSYSSYDAASGGYRAFYELLEREGVAVSRFERHPAYLDASIGTLVWSEPLAFDERQGETTRADARALEAWVRAGGRLAYFGYDDAAAKTGLLSLPSSRYALVPRARPALAASLRAAGVRAAPAAGTIRRWSIPAPRRRPPGFAVLAADARGPYVVAYRFGRGRVVASIDESLPSNARIGEPGVARFAVALVAPPGAGAVAFDEAVHGRLVPEHWWSLVPPPFLYALGLALVAIVVAIAGAAVRLGPPAIPPPADDRTSAEFIDAAASLLRRGGASRKALTDAAASATHALARAVGLPDDAAPEAIAARLTGERSRATYGELRALLATRGGDRDLVRGVTLAQRLRKEAAAHGLERN